MNDIAITNDNRERDFNKEGYYPNNSRGSLIYCIEMAYLVMKTLGRQDMADEMCAKIKKCTKDREVEIILQDCERRLTVSKPIDPGIKKNS